MFTPKLLPVTEIKTFEKILTFITPHVSLSKLFIAGYILHEMQSAVHETEHLIAVWKCSVRAHVLMTCSFQLLMKCSLAFKWVMRLTPNSKLIPYVISEAAKPHIYWSEI